MTISADSSSIRASACGASPVWPAVSVSQTGQPSPRTAMWCSDHHGSGRGPDRQTPFLSPGRVLVGAHDDGVDDQILEGVIRHRLKETPPYALGTPPAEAAEDAVPLAKGVRQIAPGRSRAHDPEHGFHKHPVVAARPAARA